MRPLSVLVPLAALLVVGCDPKPAVNPLPGPPPVIELKPVTVAEFDQFVAAQKGKVVLVDCWFLGCGPCVKKFPDFVKLHQAHAGQGLVCVSLNVYQEEWPEKPAVEAFLKKENAAFANFIFKDVRKTVDDWQDKHDANATPNYLVWDRSGKKVTLPYPQKHEAVEKMLVDLLAEK